MNDRNYDVVVAGAGPAGISAAIYASQNGAKVLLVERSGFVGGMSTDGMLNIFCGKASGGLFAEICNTITVQKAGRTIYDIEELKQFYFDKLKESGVELLFNSIVDKVEMKENRIESIFIPTSLGTQKISANYFIDATGDGTLAANAGCGCWFGRETDGKMQPSTLIVRIGGVDDERAVYPTFSKFKEYQQLLQEAVKRKEVPEPAGHIIIIQDKYSGMAYLNMTNCIEKNGADVWERSQAEITCRSQIKPLMKFIKENLPGFENSFVLQTAQYVGVRESRHFYGEYIITEQDIQNGTVFEDWCVSHAHYGFGVHNLSGSGKDQSDKKGVREYTIPYRSLLPKEADNLLLAGRCISGTHLAHSSYRVMPICMAMGQAAGTAVAIANQNKCSLRLVNMPLLQKTLMSQGIKQP